MVAGVVERPWRATLRAAVLATVGMLVACSMAFGQAAVDQYIPSTSPAGHHHKDKDKGSASDSGSTQGSSSESGTSSDDQSVAGVPTGNGGGGGGGKVGGSGAPSARIPAIQADSGSSSGEEVPGTDYPVPVFVLIVAGIALLVLAARYVPPLIRRIRLRGAP